MHAKSAKNKRALSEYVSRSFSLSDGFPFLTLCMHAVAECFVKVFELLTVKLVICHVLACLD